MLSQFFVNIVLKIKWASYPMELCPTHAILFIETHFAAIKVRKLNTHFSSLNTSSLTTHIITINFYIPFMKTIMT